MSIEFVSFSKGPKNLEILNYLEKINNNNTDTNKKIYENIMLNHRKEILTNKFFGASNDRVTYKFEEEIKHNKSISQIKVEEYLNSIEMKVDDYIKGTCSYCDTEKDNRQFKIGKILSKNNKEDLLRIFQNDSVRASSKTNSWCITVSRNPVDIALMSTYRGWSSCMGINSGNFRYVNLDMGYGTLVAYLHKEDDMELINPTSRILIKGYNYLSNHERSMIYSVSNRVYGTSNKEFKNKCEEIVKVINSKIIKKSTVLISAKFNDALYNDGDNRTIRFIDVESPNFTSKVIRLMSTASQDFYETINSLEVDVKDKIKLYKSFGKYHLFPVPNQYKKLDKNLDVIDIKYNLSKNFSTSILTNFDGFDEKIGTDILDKSISESINNNLYVWCMIVNLLLIYNYTSIESEYISNLLSKLISNRTRDSENLMRIIHYNTNKSKIKDLISSLIETDNVKHPPSSLINYFYNREYQNVLIMITNQYDIWLEEISSINTSQKSSRKKYLIINNKLTKLFIKIGKSPKDDYEKIIIDLKEDKQGIKTIFKEYGNMMMLFNFIDMSCVENYDRYKEIFDTIYGEDPVGEYRKSKVYKFLINKISNNSKNEEDIKKAETVVFDKFKDFENYDPKIRGVGIMTYCFDIHYTKNNRNYSFYI